MSNKATKIPLPPKTCKREGCGRTFIPYRSWQEFHSPRCRALHYWMTHEVVKTDDGEYVIEISPEQTHEKIT